MGPNAACQATATFLSVDLAGLQHLPGACRLGGFLQRYLENHRGLKIGFTMVFPSPFYGNLTRMMNQWI